MNENIHRFLNEMNEAEKDMRGHISNIYNTLESEGVMKVYGDTIKTQLGLIEQSLKDISDSIDMFLKGEM